MHEKQIIPIKHSLATHLLKVVVAVYLLLTVILTSVHLYTEFFRTKERVMQELQVIQKTFAPGLAKALWDMNVEQLQPAFLGIVQYPSVIGVKLLNERGAEVGTTGVVTDEQGEAFMVNPDGKKVPVKGYSGIFSYTAPIIHSRRDKQHTMGEATIYSSTRIVFDMLKPGFMLIMLNTLIKIVAVWGLFLVIFRTQLSRPLGILTSAVKQLDVKSLHDVKLDVKTSGRNELKVLEEAFNAMAQKLYRSHQQLDLFNQRLEKKVEERTAELQETNTALHKAKESAETANRAKSEFLANMSHELRTPLNVILGFTQIMARNPKLPPEERDNLGTIQRSGDHLLTLINQVLDFSKIEAGRTTVNATPFDLYSLLDDVNAMFSRRAKQKRLRVVFDVASDVPRHVCTDAVKLRQILINVLNNAIKFTHEGQIRVDVTNVAEKEIPSLLQQTQDTALVELQFSIVDTGVGIAPEEMDALFEAFAQTESGRHLQEGTGLGLPISRRFVQLLGGDMSATSEAGRGTTFRFTIQLTVIEDANIERTPTLARAIALEPGQPHYRLLIVDDKPDNRAVLLTLLTPFGFDLQEATNGQDAVEIWNVWKPHLIWMDRRMPVMGGYEATNIIRNEEGCTRNATTTNEHHQSSTIILAMSASSGEDERAMALSKGCDDFLRKPFLEADMFAMMQAHLGVRFVYEEEHQAAGSTKQNADLKGLTPEALSALPSDVLARLEKAGTTCEMEIIVQVIADIRVHDPALADALTGLVEEFAYDTILAAIQESQASPLTPQALALLPDAWYTPLKQAIEEIDLVAVTHGIQHIQSQHSQLAARLTELVQQYRFDILQDLFASVEDETEQERKE